jgi:hypothetical protein
MKLKLYLIIFLQNSSLYKLGLEVLTAVSMKMAVFWVVARVTTCPAFCGTVLKTYVKSCVLHFAWNVLQISFFIIQGVPKRRIHKVNIPYYNVYTSFWDTLYIQPF